MTSMNSDRETLTLQTESFIEGAQDTSRTRKLIQLSNRQKAAVVLAYLGPQKASPLLKEVSEEEAIALVSEIVSLPKLDSDTIMAIMEEFLSELSKSTGGESGPEVARKLLEERLGPTRAQEIIEQMEGQKAASPLARMMLNDPQQAISLLSEQQPQVVAVILAYLPPGDAASLLSQLDPVFRLKVAKRIAQLTRVDPSAIRQATNLLVNKLRKTGTGSATTNTGGTAAIAEILNHSDRNLQEKILDDIASDEPELAEQIRAKLFTFDDLMKLEERALQQIFRKADPQTLALALKTPNLSQETVSKIRQNLSERVVGMVDEEIEVMGSVRGSQISAAHASLVAIARQLDQEGIITIQGEDEVLA